MGDSQPLDSREQTLKQPQRDERNIPPALAYVASPSPAKARRRPATERPSLPSANLAPVKLPSELFAIATSRSSQGDMALGKALDGIQAAATRLETERTKLVIQSQELQIWDMAREEELVLLRAENEQLEQQLAAVAEKVGKGAGRDGVLESLQYALRKARMERDAEMREADSLFNQLQEAKAAAMELQGLRAAFSAALNSLRDEWSAVPLLSNEARELRERADAAMQDPTNLGHKDMATLLRGLLALASRGTELQDEVQVLRGEKAALQQALDAAHEQLSEQARLLGSYKVQVASGPLGEPVAPPAAEAQLGIVQQRDTESVAFNPGHGHGDEPFKRASALQQQISELKAKLEEYRSYVAENQEEIEGLQAELKRLRQAPGQALEADARAAISHGVPRGQRPHGASSSGGGGGGGSSSSNSNTAIGAVSGAQCVEPARRRQTEQQQPKPLSTAQQVEGTPTRHFPSNTSPISTVNYGSSPLLGTSPPVRSSPVLQQATADFALKVAELQELAVRAQQEAAIREAEVMQQQEEALETLRQQLLQQKDTALAELAVKLAEQQAAALAEVQTREAQLARQHSHVLVDLETQAAKQSAQHAEAIEELNARIAKLVGQHAQAIAEQKAASAAQLQKRMQEREAELQHQHANVLAAQAAAAKVQLTEALAAQAADMARKHAEERRGLEERLNAQAKARLYELEAALERRFSEQLAARDAETRRKHADRLAEQAAELARLHADQTAQLGMQHAEATAKREAQLLDQIARQLVQHESQLANAHADQLRDLEARFAAQAAEVVAAREAQLRGLFAKQLASALRQGEESFAAAQAEAKMQEAVRTAVAEAAAAQAARELEDDMRRREEEMVSLLEEQGRRVELLRRQVLKLQVSVAGSGPETAQDCANAASGTEAIGGGSSDSVSKAGNAKPLDGVDADVVGEGGDPVGSQVRQLAEQSEQLQRLADELEAVLEEAERRRDEAVANVERQYVDIVAQLGREHEKAIMEARAVHELREDNLRRVLERQEQAAQAAESRHSDQLERLQVQLMELRTLLLQERERHSSSSTALEERVAKLAAELEATRKREAQAVSALLVSRQDREHPVSELANSNSGSCRFHSLTVADLSPAPTIAELSSGAADAWPDGQALLWPAGAPAAASIPAGSSRSTTACASVGGPVADMAAAAATSAPSDEDSHSPVEPSPRLGARAKMGQVPNRDDISRDPVPALSGLQPLAVIGLGAMVRESSSLGFDLQSMAREESRQEHCLPCATALSTEPALADIAANAIPEAVEGARATGIEGGKMSTSTSIQSAAAPHGYGEAGRGHSLDTPTALQIAASSSRAANGEDATRTSNGHEQQTGASRREALGEPVGTPQGATGQETDRAATVPATAAVRPTISGAATAAVGGSGCSSSAAMAAAGPGYISEAATSVSTDTEYNSDTEFYVDDEDDEEHRGRALAAALAQSPRGSQGDIPQQLPPLLQELHKRQRSQTLGAEVDTLTAGRHFPEGAASMADDAVQAAAPSSVTPAGKDARGTAILSQPDSGGGSGPRGGTSAYDLEATFWGLSPVVDMKLLAGREAGTADTPTTSEPSSEAIAAPPVESVLTTLEAAPAEALATINLEATLSGSFPLLARLLPTLQRHPPSQFSEYGETPTDYANAGNNASSPVPASFSFPGPQRDAPSWGGTAFGDGNQFIVASEQSEECEEEKGRSRPGNAVATVVPPERTDFEFSSSAQLWSRSTASAPPQADAPEDSSMEPPFNSADGEEPGSIEGSEDASAQHADAELSSDENYRGSNEPGTSLESPTDCSLPPLTRIRPAIQRQVWVDLTDDGEGSTADDYDDFRSDDLRPMAASFPSNAFALEGSRLAEGGITWPLPPAAARAAAGITPLLLPNPLYSETGEVSPPWSAADWNATSSPLDQQMQDEGGSLPSTPGSESGGNREHSDDTSNSYSSASPGEGPAESLAEGGVAYGAWDTLYDVPGEHSAADSQSDSLSSQLQAEEGGYGRESAGSSAQTRTPRCRRGTGLLVTSPGKGAADGSEGGETCGAAGWRAGGGKVVKSCEQTTEEQEDHEELEGSGYGRSDPDDDDMRSLLAAGATLSNSERRRRHRRRMGDAPSGPPLEHPINLLRQGWEFSGGVASPISPRSTPREQGTLEVTWQVSSPQQRAAAAVNTDSQDERFRQLEAQQQQELQELLPLHALQHGRSGPSQTRHSGTSTPSPRASPLSKSPVLSRGAVSPAGTVASQGNANSFSACYEPSPGEVSVLVGSPPPSSIMAKCPLSPLEARQRSRTVLGRARSRVAELEGQCRALAASLHPGALTDDMGPATAASPLAASSPHSVEWVAAAHSEQATPSQLNRRSSHRAWQKASLGGEGGLFSGQHDGTMVAGSASDDCDQSHDSCSNFALVSAQPPPAPAEVVDALEDLRCDLNELETLHRLAIRAAKGADVADRSPEVALMSPDPRPVVLLLAGLAGGAVAAAAAAAAAAAVGPPTEEVVVASLEAAANTGDRQGTPQAGSSPFGIVCDAAAMRPASASAEAIPGRLVRALHNDMGYAAAEPLQPTGQLQPTWFEEEWGKEAEGGTESGNCRSSTSAASSAAPAAVASSDRTAPARPDTAPLPELSGGSTWQVRGYSGKASAAAEAALSPAPMSPLPTASGASSLDPALVALLHLSIQAQVQGQLGQLEAKIADLQRQNQALLAAATAASTPATPLPPSFRHLFGAAATTTTTTTTTLPLTPMRRALDSRSGGGGITGANDGMQEQPLVGDQSTFPWRASPDLLWAQISRIPAVSTSVDRLGPLREAWSASPAFWESTSSPSAAAMMTSGPASQQGRAHMRTLSPMAGAMATTVLQPPAGPALTPAHAGLRASALTDISAGPYSPEELSQLPPTIQLFAPPQLRAAALAAVREQQIHRNSL